MGTRKIIYLIGVTCSGKDYFIDECVAKEPTIFGSVNVGREFRARYPAGFFKGLGAMSSTEDEAFEIFEAQLQAAGDKPVVLVSGQPRLPSQVDRIMGKYPGEVVWMHQPDAVLVSRLESRFAKEPDAEDLARARLANDRIQLYDVLFELTKRRIPIHVNVNNDSARSCLALFGSMHPNSGVDLYV